MAPAALDRRPGAPLQPALLFIDGTQSRREAGRSPEMLAAAAICGRHATMSSKRGNQQPFQLGIALSYRLNSRIRITRTILDLESANFKASAGSAGGKT